MAPTATSPVRMPKSASTYDSATQDPELRSEINTVLLRDGHIARYLFLSLLLLPPFAIHSLSSSYFFFAVPLIHPLASGPVLELEGIWYPYLRRNIADEEGRIQEHLLHTLHASPTNWPTLIQNHALSLLRSGEIHTFPQLMERVLEDIKSDSDAARSFDTSATNGTGNGKTKDGMLSVKS